MNHLNIPVLIPAYLPDNNLITLVKDLILLGVKNIIIVRDGGGKEYDEIFDNIQTIKECHIVTHSINLGKGRALKNGHKLLFM